MPIENEALNFNINIKTPGLATVVNQVVRGLDTMADAAERLHKAVVVKKKTALERMFEAKMAKSGPAQLKALRIGFIGLNTVYKGMAKTVDKGVQDWIESYNQIVEWRKAVGMTTRDVQDLGTVITGTTAKYTFQLGKVVSISRFMQQGMKDAKKEIVDLSAALGEFERMTGTSSQTTAALAKTLVQQRKAMSPEEFQNTLFAIRDSMREVSVSTDEWMGSIGRLSGVFQEWGKDRAPGFLRDMTAFTAAIAEAGGTVSDAEGILSDFTDTGSQVSNLYRVMGFDIEKTMQQLASLAAQTEEDFKSRQAFAESFGLTVDQVNLIMQSAANIAKHRKTFEDTLGRSIDDNRKKERERATGLEKLKLQWDDVTNSISRLSATITNHLQPTLLFIAEIFSGIAETAKSAIDKTTMAVETGAELLEKLTGRRTFKGADPGQNLKSAQEQFNRVLKANLGFDKAIEMTTRYLQGVGLDDAFMATRGGVVRKSQVMGAGIPPPSAPAPVNVNVQEEDVVRELRGLRQDLENGRREDRHNRLTSPIPQGGQSTSNLGVLGNRKSGY